MWIVGPASSVFDFLLFYIMLKIFNAGETLFHAGWLIKFIATQVLVIFVIRTRNNPFRSRPSTALTLASLAVLLVATALPFMPLQPALALLRSHRFSF